MSSYTGRYGGYSSSSRYSSDLPSYRSTDRPSSRDYGTSSYRRDSNSSSRYGPLDYGSTRYTSYSTSKDGGSGSTGRYDYTTSRYTDPDRFSKYRATSDKEKVVEKEYDAPTVVEEAAKEDVNETPAIEKAHDNDNSEVLQESDVDHFSTDPVVEEPAEDDLISYHSEEPVESYEPEPEPQPEPVYVTETTVRRMSLNSPNENIKPEGAGSPKKLGGGVWPPREENFYKGGALEEGAAPGKKRISDLIARFNSGSIENEGTSKNDHRYKTEYGAGGQRGGKVQQSVFQ